MAFNVLYLFQEFWARNARYISCWYAPYNLTGSPTGESRDGCVRGISCKVQRQWIISESHIVILQIDREEKLSSRTFVKQEPIDTVTDLRPLKKQRVILDAVVVPTLASILAKRGGGITKEEKEQQMKKLQNVGAWNVHQILANSEAIFLAESKESQGDFQHGNSLESSKQHRARALPDPAGRFTFEGYGYEGVFDVPLWWKHTTNLSVNCRWAIWSSWTRRLHVSQSWLQSMRTSDTWRPWTFLQTSSPG